MPLRVYDTLTKTKHSFEPLVPGKVGIYLCGPTVYKPSHIGHMVGPVIFDTVKRYLVYNGYQVTWVVNITDVDDKLIVQAKERGITMSQVATEMTADYLTNLKALGVDQIDQMPKATDNIEEIIGFISDLIAKGYAYPSAGDVFFDVAKDAEYGKLSNRSADSQQGEGGEAASKKRSPGDFALWKAAKPGEPSWKSPWGDGRPGWHIECSAMSRRILGKSFDIHGGGLDLMFPHHENELAQSECCHGQPMVKYWMHNGLMRAAAAGKVGGRAEREKAEGGDEQATVDTKISRSKGAGGLADLIARQGGEKIRFFLLRTHYRSTIVFSEEGIQEAGVGLDSFVRFFERYQRVTGQSFYDLAAVTQRTAGEFDPGGDPLLAEVHERRTGFLTKMDDDFNTGGAVSDLFELARSLNKFVDQHQLEDPAQRDAAKLASLARGVATLRELTAILGLFRRPEAPRRGGDDALVGKLMELLTDLRNELTQKNADTILQSYTDIAITSEGGKDDFVGKLMELFIKLRAESRVKKDFATADKIRKSLTAIGVTLEDRKGGTDWRREG